MTDTSGPASSDFASHSANQTPVSHQHLQQPYGRYDAERATSAPGLSEASPISLPVQDPALRYTDFNHQSQFGGFAFNPQAPAGWEWSNSIDFTDFSNQYEPQGELLQELQNQSIAPNDFSIPLPVTTAGSPYQSLQQPRSANPTPPGAQSVLSPPPRPTPPRPAVQTGMKRKVDSEPGSAVSQGASILIDHPPKRHSKSRQSSEASVSSPGFVATSGGRRPSVTQAGAASGATETTSQSADRRKEQSKGTGPQGRVIDVSKPRRVVESSTGPDVLPAGKVFPIQIGSQLFRLSGASISSDAPSYFSHFFGEQLAHNGGRAGDVRTLYIDRDPETFRDIALHLQGYHITPKDGEHFVKLFADAQFYSLPRLTKQLFSTDIFIRIGGIPFQIPRDLFSAPGDSPNYFSLGFAQFFSTPSEVFPGLDRSALLRPPSISPPSVPNRSGETFGELIQLLQGYNLDIRDDAHRTRLLRDARYFHLKGLEQRLIPCEISYNLKRQQSEILVRLEDIRQSGISFSPDKASGDPDSGTSSSTHDIGISPGHPSTSKAASPAPSFTSNNGGIISRGGFISYARPYTDDHSNNNTLILEVSTAESTTLLLPFSAPKISSSESLEFNARATFHNAALARMSSLFSVIASKMGLPAMQPLGLMYLQSGGGVAAQPISPANSGVSERRVRVRLDTNCALSINGEAAEIAVDEKSGRVGIRAVATFQEQNKWLWGGSNLEPDNLTLRPDEEEPAVEWTVKRVQWRIRVEPIEIEGDAKRMQVVLCCVKMEAFSVERNRNSERGFLGSS